MIDSISSNILKINKYDLWVTKDPHRSHSNEYAEILPCISKPNLNILPANLQFLSLNIDRVNGFRTLKSYFPICWKMIDLTVKLTNFKFPNFKGVL